MRERLENLLDKLNGMRTAMLEEYLQSLEVPLWSSENSQKAIDRAGFVHDIDRHITNVVMEIKRCQTEVVHAS